MNHPLDGARLKIVWAQEHLDRLKAETLAFIGTDPYRLIVQGHVNNWSVVPRTLSVPDSVGLILGDCIGCMRAALDYVAWALAEKHAKRSLRPPPDGADKPYFPIFNKPGAFRGVVVDGPKGLAKNYSVPADTIRELEAVQPYPGRDQSLWSLYLLVNQDKHRLPLLTVCAIQGADVYAVVHGVWTQIAGNITDDQISVGYTAENPLESDHVKMQIQATVFVTFDDVAMPREPIDRTLEQIIKTVAEVIRRFDTLVV
jgi:hypothetical protein